MHVGDPRIDVELDVEPGIAAVNDLEADPYELRNVIADPDNRPMRRILERELSRLRES